MTSARDDARRTRGGSRVAHSIPASSIRGRNSSATTTSAKTNSTQIVRLLGAIRDWREADQRLSFESRTHMKLNETDMRRCATSSPR